MSSFRQESAAALKARALRLLARREHSRDELARKLSPHADSPQVLEALLRDLETKKQLSNERFAEVRAHWLSRKYGAAKTLDGQVERLLKDPRSNRFIENFLGQWLKLRAIAAKSGAGSSIS